MRSCQVLLPLLLVLGTFSPILLAARLGQPPPVFTPKSQQRLTARETNTCEERQTPGLICETCSLLSTCVRHSEMWVNIPVETCDTEAGFFCNSRLGACSNMTGPCHPFGFDANFPCTSQGVFPDPYDCQKYHICYFVGGTLVTGSVDCGGDKAFNAASGQCSLTLGSPTCQQKQYDCRDVGEAHAWPSNPNIFYICKASSSQDERVVYPALYRCADGEIFDGYICRTFDWDGNAGPPSTWSPTAGIPGHTTPTTRDPNGPPNGQCREMGLQADPENCKKYYYCSAINGALKHLECPSGTHYNAASSSCTLGSC